MKLNQQVLIVSSLLGVSSTDAAKVYLCNGNTYADHNINHQCQLAVFEKLNTYSSFTPVLTATAKKGSSRRTIAIANTGQKMTYPDNRISQQTQKARDQTRKQILNEELHNEMTALAYSRNQIFLAQATKNVLRAQQLQAEVSEHQDNIQVISQELARLR
ncbi:MAG: hypothetical protein DI619_04715 [Francisella sp.]|jgi:hypothetical protein|nr:MAG: hypothetical protein DI619_04715 [Francisella sp.]